MMNQSEIWSKKFENWPDINRKIFCEPHWPFKLIQEIEEKWSSKLEEIEEFYEVFSKCLKTMKRVPIKKGSDYEKNWRDKDKKTLFDKVRHIYINMKKLWINVVRYDPNKPKKVKD